MNSLDRTKEDTANETDTRRYQMPHTKNALLMILAIILVKIGLPKTSYQIALRAGYSR